MLIKLADKTTSDGTNSSSARVGVWDFF